MATVVNLLRQAALHRSSERMNYCPVVGGRKYDVECGLVRRGPIGSRWGPISSRWGPMGSDWVISHTGGEGASGDGNLYDDD